MKETTDWTPKNGSETLKSTGPREQEGGSMLPTESGLLKAGLAIAAGLIITALVKGFKDSDYYD